MNYIKTITILCLLLITGQPSWAQKKPLFKAAYKAVAGLPDGIPTERPHAKLLADTKAFIHQHGHRPHAYITDERGLRMLARNLNDEQRLEVKLGGIVARTLTAFRTRELNPNDPDLKELQALVAAHPNVRNTAQVTPYLLKHQESKRRELIAYVYTQTQKFIEANGRRPRVSIHENGLALTLKEIKQKYPRFYDEIWLGRHINSLLNWGKKNAPDHPQLNQLRNLVSAHTNRVNSPNPSAILQELRAFIADHNRLPRRVIIKNKKRFPVLEISSQEHQEVLLANHASNLLRKPATLLSPEDQLMVAQIQQTIQDFRAQYIQRVLEQLRRFADTYNRLPRASIFVNHQRIATENLSAEEQEEVLLKARLEYVLYKLKRDGLPAHSLSLIDEIKQIIAPYNPPRLNEAELLAQANAWVSAHPGFRPRDTFYKNRKNVAVRTLSHEQYEEVLLARRIRRAIERAAQITPALEGLQRILQLPVRPQLPDELKDTVQPEPATQEETDDDIESYFQ